ncbi:Threonine synthase [Lentilactobacillus hilgardii]|uniref:threonine synthase n=1 Tax=Lentilactobacillus hilgardii TaxID=1588 RepID=UPI00019C4609|nr:threonine synthase [Lentilactobacillus hilgardii]EEI20899.1 threonine synthase [Lentilactobacillus buchneri ATCC 11577]MCT3397304.1 threonine synthase [Lentilactobacillus hilgardii]QIR10728.1 Threonine synthase [Lentilactobacillus hilgardii]
MNKNYTSTRNDSVSISAKEAIKKGFADDKGLFVYPDLGNDQLDLEKILTLDYKNIAKTVLAKLLPDFSKGEINDSVDNAYSSSFDSDKITPVAAVDNFHILELFHGPTSAFKDVGLQLLPQLMKHVLTDDNKVMILTATSGDTGKAALEGFKDLKNMGIIVFYPDGGVSKIQKLQMITTGGNNTKVAAIKGNFDDAQTNVKLIFNDNTLKEQLGSTVSLSSANSINIGRLIPQVVYYFDSYKQLVEDGTIKTGNKVNFTVPTGNFGDVLAGYYAKLLGLPVNKFVVACNENNVLATFFEHGIYDRNRPFFQTIAPSMDIQISSNFERLLYYKSGENSQYVKQLMDDLENNGKYEVSKDVLKAIQEDFYCGYSTDKEIEESIKEVYEKDGYLMDPHTAAGYKVMRDYQKLDDTPMILLSTASPYKFVNAVATAVLPEEANSDNVLQTMKDLAAKTNAPIPENLQKVWDLPVRHESVIQKSDMEKYVKEQVEAVFYDKDQSSSN